jgi:hypothetical protein
VFARKGEAIKKTQSDGFEAATTRQKLIINRLVSYETRRERTVLSRKKENWIFG